MQYRGVMDDPHHVIGYKVGHDSMTGCEIKDLKINCNEPKSYFEIVLDRASPSSYTLASKSLVGNL